MNYWLCITNEENWKVVKAKNIWGVPEGHKKQLNEVEIGDFFVFYLKGEKVKDVRLPPRISGIFKVVSKPFKDENKIFSSVGFKNDEIFSHRVKLDPLIIKNKEFKPFIPKLTFIKNKKKWQGHIQGKAMRSIPKEDFKLIMKDLSK